MNIYRVTMHLKGRSDSRIFLKVVAWNAKAAETIAKQHVIQYYQNTPWVFMYAAKMKELKKSPKYQRILSEKVKLR